MEKTNDKFIIALVLNDYEEVKKAFDSGAIEGYKNKTLSDFGFIYSDAPLPLYSITQAWLICLNNGSFSEPLKTAAKRNYENAKKIMALFEERLGGQAQEIPFAKIFPCCWADEDESESDILEGEKAEFVARGAREIDLDLLASGQRMDFARVRELLEKGANPLYEHPGLGSLLDLCGGECSYQATCEAGFIIKNPELFRQSIEIEEIAKVFRWAANEKMYNLLAQYVPTSDGETCSNSKL